MKKDLLLLARLWPHAKPDAWVFVYALAVTPLIAAMSLVQPWLLKRIIDDHVVVGTVEGLGQLALFYLGAVVGAYFIESTYTLAMAWGGTRMILRLRSALYAHALKLKQRFFDKQPAGKILTRLTTDLDSLGDALSAGIVTILLDLLMIVGTVAAMFWLDWQLSLIMMFLLPIMLWALNGIRRRLKQIFLEIRDSIASINAYLAERIDGVEVLQLFGAEADSAAVFDEKNLKYRNLASRSNVYDSLMYSVVDGMGSIFVAVILAFGAGLIAQGLGLEVFGSEVRTAGLLVAYIDYMQRLFRPLRDASGKIAVIQRATASLQKIEELFADAELAGSGDAALPTLEGHLVLEDVWFRYSEEGEDVLRGVSLEVQPGEVVAIVGATGSGKTTLGRLLDRSYEGYRGRIQLDGVDLVDIRTEDLRRSIAAVRQDIQLFSADLQFNVDLDNDAITDGQRRLSTSLVSADALVERLGWTHLLRERGADLSVGEGQLIAFARTMAYDPAVVIMDEATASVDSVTEQQIQNAIAAIMEQKTAIVIAHRLSTIKQADRICVMSRGAIVEQGTHDTLMEKGGRYAELVRAGLAAVHGNKLVEQTPGV